MRQILSPSRFIRLALLLFAPALLASPISPYLAAEFSLKLTNTSGIQLSQQNYQPWQIQFNQLQFNLIDKHISSAASIDENRNTPITQAQSFTLSNWENEYLPLLNNVPVKITGKSLALSISDDEKHFVLASDKETVLFSRSGKRLWHHAEVSTTISTLISVNKKYIISLFSNGVLRWLNYTDGKPLFSLYLSPETRDWIIWTPQGYFDTSSAFFNPLLFDTSTSVSNSLSQLREMLFSPEKITAALSIEGNQTYRIPENALMLPEASFKIKDGQSVDLCIKTPSSSVHDAIVAINGVTVSRKPAVNTSSGCQFQTQVKLSTQDKIKNIRVTAVSQQTSTRSLPVTQSLNSKPEESSSRQTAFLIPQHSKQTKLIKLLNNNYKIQHPVKQSLERLNNAKFNAFILYLYGNCTLGENDIELVSRDGNENIKLSELSHRLQNVNIIDSLIAIECIVATNTANMLATKRLIYNFMADTGRSTIAQFITKEQLKLATSKQTILESVVSEALEGEADLNDDLSINSEELLDYITRNLPLKNFELTGDQGIYYIYNDQQNSFDIPLKKQAQ